MPFGLRNAGATFQRLMHIALGQQLGRNAKAYVDDIVVKSQEARTLIQDLEETFASLRKVDLRLNPEKCVFGIPSGKLLGFLVSHRGIEVNPEKVKAIVEMSPPRTLKEMQKLAGCVTSLGRFISKLRERALPFFKLMKKKGSFEWTPEADAAFQDLKRYLTSPPVMVAPRPLEALVLYLAAMPHSASAALAAVREERQVKGLTHDAARPAEMVQNQDGAPEATTAPADDQDPQDGAPEATPAPTGNPTPETPSLRRCPTLRRRPSLRRSQAPPTLPLSSSTRYGEKVSNNIAEYEGLIAGLKAATALGVKRLTIKGDSQLLVNFSNKVYEPKDEHMEAYLAEVRKMEKQFLGLELQHVPRGTNKEADDIAKRASRRLPQEPGVFEERLFKPSTSPPAAETAPPQEELPTSPTSGALAYGLTSGARLLLVLEPHEGCWTKEFKAYLLRSRGASC
ncbi:unnamed protein product [Triticum aestivum]|uniref:RNase H type-1 domain-containing protein n=1 Tax=Triticum aestivum TaxID=4565 RepID=A0A7H4LII3_WHEAT|nr:unnamed protein product [Triticum aestivum]